jgi:hypothetical protein
MHVNETGRQRTSMLDDPAPSFYYVTTMNTMIEQILISKIRTLTSQQVAEVNDFVEFLITKTRKRLALDRLLAIAPALEATGVAPMNEDEIAAEVKVARTVRYAKTSN